MKITQVEYRELVTGRNYSNTTVGATALVGEDEVPDEVLSTLKVWVRAELGNQEQLKDLHGAVWAVDQTLCTKRRELEELKEKVEQVKAILAAHGMSAADLDSFPF